jgi:hypothetical protein
MTIMAKTSLQNVNNKLEASQTFRGLVKDRWFVEFFGATIFTFIVRKRTQAGNAVIEQGCNTRKSQGKAS